MKYICVVLNTKKVTMMTIEELKQECIDLIMSIEDEEIMSKILVYVQNLIDEQKKTVYNDVAMEKDF